MESSTNSSFYFTPALRIVLFFAVTGISLILGGFISFFLAASILQVDFAAAQQLLLLPENAKIAQFSNALASIIAFGIPSLTAFLMHKGSLSEQLGLNALKSTNQIVVVAVLALSGLVLSGALGDLTQHIPLPTQWKIAADEMEAQYKKALLAMTQMSSIFDLLMAIIAVAVIPAIVEELYFRAGLQKILMDWSGKPHVAILLTAILFSAFHFSYFGFLSRMALGLVLGYIYFFTKTIWLPIFMHFINNAIGITALYFVRADAKKVEALIDQNLSYYWLFLAILIVIFLLKKLNQISNEQRLGNRIQ